MYIWPSLVAQLVKNLPAMWKTWVQTLVWEDPLEKGRATHSSILTWRTPWTVRSVYYTPLYSPWDSEESDSIEWFSLSLFIRIFRASLVAQTVKNLPATKETWIQSLDWEDPLEKETAVHSNILAWRIPWTEEPGGLQSMRSRRVGHHWATFTYIHI